MDLLGAGHYSVLYSMIGPLILLLITVQGNTGNTGNSDLMELDLEREILKHTIQFLKNKLITCMKDTGGRERNKVQYIFSTVQKSGQWPLTSTVQALNFSLLVKWLMWQEVINKVQPIFSSDTYKPKNSHTDILIMVPQCPFRRICKPLMCFMMDKIAFNHNVYIL